MGYQSRHDLPRLQVRIEGREEQNDQAARLICETLENAGYEIIEWSRPFPIRSDPESGVLRTYVTAVRG